MIETQQQQQSLHKPHEDQGKGERYNYSHKIIMSEDRFKKIHLQNDEPKFVANMK